MKNLKVNRGLLKSSIRVHGSKSYANRLLIIGSLKKEPFTIRYFPQSTDVIMLIDALKQSGLDISQEDNTLTIRNSFPECETTDKVIAVGEGGTTARFLASMLLKGERKYSLLLGSRLSQRPWDEFIKFVLEHGGEACLSGDLLNLKGPLKFSSDEVKVDCSRTTQFASGLQMAFWAEGMKILPVNLHSSNSYWSTTIELCSLAEEKTSFNIPSDWSSASYPMAFAALNQTISFPGLKIDPFQSDAKLAFILKQLGSFSQNHDGITIEPYTHSMNIEVNVADCLDLVPTLCFLLSHIPGEHSLEGVSNLVHKESDRLAEVQKLMAVFGRNSMVRGNKLHISGSSERLQKTVELTMPDDHRMVMVGTLFLLHHGGGTVSPVEAVNKSFPDFFQMLSV